MDYILFNENGNCVYENSHEENITSFMKYNGIDYIFDSIKIYDNNTFIIFKNGYVLMMKK